MPLLFVACQQRFRFYKPIEATTAEGASLQKIKMPPFNILKGGICISERFQARRRRNESIRNAAGTPVGFYLPVQLNPTAWGLLPHYP